MRVLSISSDRSKRGILFPGTAAFKRQEAYAKQFGNLDIIGFSRAGDGAKEYKSEHLHIIPTNSLSRFLYGFGGSRIAKTLRKPDVISVQDPFETGLVGWRLARKCKVPLHVQVHTDFLSPQYVRLSLLNRLRVVIARFVLRRASRIRVVSGRIAEGVRKLTRAPVTVLPIYVDIERMAHLEHSPLLLERYGKYAWKVLVVSRLEREKNVGLAVRAFAASAPKDACLIIVGVGRRSISLQRLAKRLKIAERVLFEDTQDAAPYYKLADLVLVPSKYEGYGLVTVEALAAGKPVLSTDVGIAREAGATVTTDERFADALAAWFKSGPRTGELKNYPYKHFEEYVRAYCDDIAACADSRKRQ